VADVQKTIEIIFGAIDNTSGVLQSVGAGIKSFADGAKDAIAPLNAAADTIKKVDTAVVALGLAFGGAALLEAGKFGGAVAEIGTLFGGTDSQVAQLETSIKNYATTSTKSIEDINGAIYTAVSAGVAWEKSIEFVTAAEKLSVAGKADLQATTLALTGTMNAYGAKTDEAGKYSDLMFKTIQLGQTTLPELATSLSMVTATAAAGKLPFEQVAAAVAGLTAAGVPTSQAMTGINAALVGIISPTKEAAEKAAELGIQFNAQALESKGLSGVLADVQKATGGNVTEMATLFTSIEALKAATALGADKSGVYAKALTDMSTAAGVTDGAYKALSQTLENTTQTLKNNANVLLIEVGQRLEGGFAGIISSITDVFKSLTVSVNAGAFDEVFAAVNGVTGRISEFLKGVAAALPEALEGVDFGKFAGAIETLADSLGGIFGDLDLTSVEGLRAAIQTAVDVIGNLITAGAGIVDAWGDAVQAAMPLIQAFGNLNSETVKSGGYILGLADVMTALLPAIGSVGGAIEALGTGLSLLGTAKLGALAVNIASSATAMGVLTTAAGTLGSAIGIAGAAGAAGAAGYAVGTVLADGIDYVVDKMTGSGSLGGLIYDLTHNTDELAASAPKAAEALTGVGESAASTATSLDTATEASGDSIRVANAMVDPFGAANKAMLDQAAAAEKTASESNKLTTANENVKTGIKGVETVVDAATGKVIGYKDAVGGVATSTKDAGEASKSASVDLSSTSAIMTQLGSGVKLTSDQLITLAKNTKDAEIKLEEIASNERIKLIEAVVTLNVAQIEAQAKQVVAAFDSINVGIESTGDLLGELFGLFKDENNLSWSAMSDIRDQIELENQWRAQEFELQKQIAEATIANMRAQTDAMLRGDGMIKIDGSGLAPHLEAFMWEVLKAVQIRVNQQGLKLLLGI